MAGKEHLVRCTLEEYRQAFSARAELRDLIVGDNTMSLSLRHRNNVEGVVGPVLATRKLGYNAVKITLLDQDMKPTDKIFFGSMPDGIWNPDKGSPRIIFVSEPFEDPTFNGVLRPYTDGFYDVEFLRASTGTRTRLSPEVLPPPFLAI